MVGGTVVQHIPLAAKLHHGAVVVPHIGVAAVAVYDNAFVLIRAEDIPGHRIGQTGRHILAAHGRIHIVIPAIPFEHKTTLVEEMLVFRHQSLMQCGHIQRSHIGIQPGALGAELVPEIIRLPVIIYEHARVYAPDAFYEFPVPEGPGGRIGNRHALGPFGEVVIEVILSVFLGYIGSIQVCIRVGNPVVGALGGKDIGMQRPVQHIVRRQQMVIGRAPQIQVQIQRAGHIQSSVQHLGAGIGHIDPHRADGIVAEFSGLYRLTVLMEDHLNILPVVPARKKNWQHTQCRQN